MKSGHGKITWPNNDYYEGSFEENLRVGDGVSYEDGLRFDG